MASSAKIMVASLPFVVIGMFGHQVCMNIAAVVGVLALVCFVVRIVMLAVGREAVAIAGLDSAVNEVLSLPYAIAISSMIVIDKGLEGESGLWLAAVLAVLIVLSNVVRKR